MPIFRQPFALFTVLPTDLLENQLLSFCEFPLFWEELLELLDYGDCSLTVWLIFDSVDQLRA